MRLVHCIEDDERDEGKQVERIVGHGRPADGLACDEGADVEAASGEDARDARQCPGYPLVRSKWLAESFVLHCAWLSAGETKGCGQETTGHE